jgi:Fe-S cluster biogenesis protein NfuA
MPDQQKQKTLSKADFSEQIEQALESVRIGLAFHKGGVELVDADPVSGIVSVRMLGMCVGCPMADMTLKMGIEETLMSLVPGITEVRAAV